MKSVDLSPLLHSAKYEEGWKALSYTYAGTFILDGKSLNSKQISNDIRELLSLLKNNRSKKFPRILCRFILIIVYCVDEVSEDVVEHLKIDNFGGRGWSAHPLLYCRTKSEIVFREAIQNQTLLIYRYLERWFDDGTKLARELDGNKK